MGTLENSSKLYIPYGCQTIGEDDIAGVVDCLRSPNLTQGERVPQFEKALSEYVHASYCVAFNSATSALHAACWALGVGAGDSVWTSANSFVASANCVRYLGGDVDFCDIDLKSGNICVDLLAAKLLEARVGGKLPKVIIVVHFAGFSAQMDRIHELKQEYGFKIIEDASHALGGSFASKPIGSNNYSEAVVFSFHPVKPITTGEGGCVTTNCSDMAAKLGRFRSHGIVRDYETGRSSPTEEIWNYAQVDLGFNYRMNDISASLGLTQLRKIESFIKRRTQIQAVYREELSSLPIEFFDNEKNSAHHLFCIRTNNRNNLYKYLKGQGLGVNIHYIPIYRHPYYKSLGFVKGYCTNSEIHFNKTVSLPIFPSLSDLHLEYSIDQIKSFFK